MSDKRIFFKINAILDEKKHMLTFTTQSMMDQVCTELIDFKEETTKKALIKLGWTPPKNK